MEEQRGYFAVIPANVRYDKRLKANSKLLYGEITALCNDKGFCWATNDYFSDLYNVNKETISRWISELIKYGYLTREIVYKEGTNQIINRYLRINQYPIDEIINRYPQKNQYPLDENVNNPIDEKVKENNTFINNTFNNTKEYIESKPSPKKSKPKSTRHKYGEYENVLLTDEQFEKLKTEFPDDWKERIERVSEYCELSGKKYKNYLAVIRVWARKDKQKEKTRSQPYTRQEQLPEWAKKPVDYSNNQPEVTDEDLRRFLEDVGDTEGF